MQEKESEIRTGAFTLPSEAGMEDVTLMLAKKWGADAIRDSDGTTLSPDILKSGYRIYSTVCLIRADQDWAKAHRDRLQQKFLMSDPVTAESDQVEIDLLAGHLRDQHAVDTAHDPGKWWQVFDRTTGQLVDPSAWSFDGEAGTVTVLRARKWHAYTVSFLVRTVWESTSMYNHITNNWTSEHQMPMDPRHPETREHLLEYLERWLAEHPRTAIVRLTSLIYQFAFVFGDHRRPRFADGQCYIDTVNPLAIEEFEREKGYRLTAEDFVDAGYYNNTCRIPTRKYLDWIDFTHKFVTGFGRDCVERIHRAGKKAIMFFCDHWIGTEPYGPRFSEMGLDAIVGPCMNGVELRKNTEVPAPIEKEVRLYPYFFPLGLSGEPVFKEGGDPVGQARKFWVMVRRAMLRKCADRIGFGGYLSLAAKHPDFLDYVERLANEFRAIRAAARKSPPVAAPFKVGILNAWGKLRSWMNGEFQKGGLMECLSGLPLEVVFLSFDDVARGGVPADVGVLVNTGDAHTAWSGGCHWTNPGVAQAVRQFVHGGGGFIGVGEPTACEQGGRFFQLADVLGVEKDTGLRRPFNRRPYRTVKEHFILEDASGPLTVARRAIGVFPPTQATGVLAVEGGDVLASVNDFGKGRAVYFGGFEYSWPFCRLLHRALYWAAGREAQLKKWFTADVHTECAAYPAAGLVAVINNDKGPHETRVFDDAGRSLTVRLEPFESRWVSMADFR